MPETLPGRVTLYCGDCLEVLAELAENSIDAVVTDPPYHLTSIVKRFGADNAAPPISAIQRRFSKTGAALSIGPDGQPTKDQYGRLSTGFMGKRWDGGDVAFRPETWAAVLRVMKPGAHLIAFGGTRTYHRMACAIEDAGFEIRDQIQWLYGSGFPKSHDVSKGIDRAAGVEREVIARGDPVKRMIPGADQNKAGWEKNNGRVFVPTETAAGSAEAAEWDGWGTALKPACEPIVLARKPLSEGTVAANVLRWRTGALNIDGCRVEIDQTVDDPRLGGKGDWSTAAMAKNAYGKFEGVRTGSSEQGRWPANLIHDGSDEVVAAFPESSSGALTAEHQINGGWSGTKNCYGKGETGGTNEYAANSGSAARFFYTAKADSDDRIGSKHPTVKPVDLIQYLVRLVTPPGGVVLDCFAGTGTLGEAAFREGFSSVLIEREDEYQADIRRRMALAFAGPEERSRESIKARGLTASAGPLFDSVGDRDA